MRIRLISNTAVSTDCCVVPSMSRCSFRWPGPTVVPGAKKLPRVVTAEPLISVMSLMLSLLVTFQRACCG